MELWSRVPDGNLRHGKHENPGLQWRQLDGLRLEHLSDRELPGVPKFARSLRSERQRRGTHESAARFESDVESQQQGARLHGDERQLVRFRHLPRARGLVSLARTVLARYPGDGREKSRQLPPEFPLLQEPELTIGSMPVSRAPAAPPGAS